VDEFVMISLLQEARESMAAHITKMLLHIFIVFISVFVEVEVLLDGRSQ
jgi:hypothetical protein